MLAPKHKLWTTPPAAVTAGLGLLNLTDGDTLVDYGCGDGRALIEAAANVKCRCIGYEINEARASDTRALVEEAGLGDLVSIKFKNALEAGAHGGIWAQHAILLSTVCMLCRLY